MQLKRKELAVAKYETKYLYWLARADLLNLIKARFNAKNTLVRSSCKRSTPLLLVNSAQGTLGESIMVLALIATAPASVPNCSWEAMGGSGVGVDANLHFTEHN